MIDNGLLSRTKLDADLGAMRTEGLELLRRFSNVDQGFVEWLRVKFLPM